MTSSENAPSRILVVDDEANNRLLLREALEAEGYLVAEADNGLAALAMMDKESPDVVLLDVMMPGMSCIEVCEQMKQDNNTAHVPVIIVMSQRERPDRLRGTSACAVDFLSKPLDLLELRLRVRNAAQAKSLYDEAQRQLCEILQLEKARDELVHMIVHDLRSPLAAMLANVQLAEMEVSDRLDEEIAKSLSEASLNCKRMIKMVDTMLDLSRIEDGKLPLKPVPTDLCELVLDVRSTLGNQLNRVSVEAEDADQVASIPCDREVMRRVIENLVGNALDYSPGGEPVSVAIGRSNGHVRLSVSDHGAGIPEESRGLIFEKFGQVGTIRKVRKASTGIGLAFCKLAVEAHSGIIGVESEVEKGSTFWFELPVNMGGSG